MVAVVAMVAMVAVVAVELQLLLDEDIWFSTSLTLSLLYFALFH